MGGGASSNPSAIKDAISKASPEELSEIWKGLDEETRQKLAAAMPKRWEDLLKARAWFTEQAEAAVKAGSAEALVKQVVEKRNQLAVTLRGEMSAEERAKTSSVFTVLHEQVITAKGLPGNWADELKIVDKGGAFTASCGGVELPVGDHFPLRRVLVSTELTRVARKAFFEGASSGKILLWCGPPGTGKTETFSDTVAELGMAARVVNCAAGMTLEEGAGHVDAAKDAGTPLVLDEANLMSADVWAAVAGKAKEAGIIMCCTFNPSAAGGVAVPPAVEEAGQKLQFTVPPFGVICEVMAGTTGFIEIEEVGSKLAAFYAACRSELPKTDHFDFGLRALKATISSMRMFAQAAGYSNELAIAAQAALFKNFPMVAPDLRDKLKAMVKEHFGSEPELPEGWPDKYVMMKDTMSVRHGVLLVGVPPADVDAHIAGIGEQAGKVGAEVARVPGTTDEDFIANFEKTLKASVAEDKKAWLVVVVGQNKDQINKSLEGLNTVLDDNKTLVTATGERTPLRSGTRVILLAQSCDAMLPATVSRVGVVAV